MTLPDCPYRFEYIYNECLVDWEFGVVKPCSIMLITERCPEGWR